MRHYEVTFIVDPVLSKEEISETAKTYLDRLAELECTIIHVDEMGLRQLTYPINKRTSGIYYCVEFAIDKQIDVDIIAALELSLRRDERLLRFLTVVLDKHGIKYNDDKRKGLIVKYDKDNRKKSTDKELVDETRD
jgi:small subunit ribosomal protein S6